MYVGLLFGSAEAQFDTQFLGPDESRTPRSAEATAFARAVCTAKIPLGPLSGCVAHLGSANSFAAVEADTSVYLPSRVLYGAFTRPKTEQALVQFCRSTGPCPGGTVLLGRQGTSWKALGLLPEFNLRRCLTFPARGGTDAAVCAAPRAQLPEYGLQVASWIGGRVQVQTLASFGQLSLTDPHSAQCREGWEVKPTLWDDRDRNRDGLPDLTLWAFVDRYPLDAQTCTSERGDIIGTKRTDLVYYWDGQTLTPTPTTRTFVQQYSAKSP